MAAAADNVIRFPDGVRGSVADLDRHRTLIAARDIMAQRLREALRSMLAEVEEDLLTLGDVADQREERNFYYGGRELVATSAMRLEGIFAAHWLGFFDQQARGIAPSTPLAGERLEDLSLVDLGELDEDIAAKAIRAKLGEACEDGLYAANRRLGYLAGRGEDAFEVDELIVRALKTSFADIALPAPLRAQLLRSTETHAVAAFEPAIHDLNAFLVGQGVMPNLRRSYAQAPIAKTVKDDPSATSGHADAADVFQLLQRLVAAQPVGSGLGSAAGGGRADMLGGGPAGVGVMGSAAAATMALAMEKVMASLDVLQRTVPAPQAMGAMSANVLREFRSSDTGQNLNYLDAVTVDIVATLFDFIFDDPAVGDPIKAVVARLQIPVLKVAMLDKSFFSSKAHPARKLLDAISRAAVRCGPNVDHQDPLYARIAAIVERLQNEFAQDTHLFDLLNGELESFLELQERSADERAAQAAPLVEAQERRELAAMAAEQSLSGWLAMPLPAAITDMLDHEWRALLVRSYLADDQTAWSEAIGTISELVASIQPHADVAGRKLLASRLPTLVKKIHDYLNVLAVPEGRRLALVDALFGLHAAVLRGTSPVVTTVWPSTPESPLPVVPEITCEHFEAGDTQLDSISLVDTPAVNAADLAVIVRDQIANLQRGDWIEFLEAGETTRYRLSWISPQRGILLFTNPQSPRAVSIAPAALALRIETGEARVVPLEPIFDRAVTRALETLKVA